MALRSEFVLLAQKLQEAMDSGDIPSSDIRSRLTDAVQDAFRSKGGYGCFLDYIGDGESGDCIYYDNGDLRKAPYELSTVNGKLAAKIDMEQSLNVQPTTSYAEEADDDDQYASMAESKKLYSSSPLPLFERFISKKERASASDEDFAGKGKSFPILKPSDVGAAVHAMGRAGSGNYGMAQLKANIIRIAKKKGWTSELPKAWQGDETKESAKPQVSPLKLFESASTIETIKLTEAKADYEIKLIAPGPGSSAFYPAEVLKRDGPKVFTAGTHVYLNHPTAMEESQRPEGDVKNLAGVLSSNAVYHESHPKGPGLYGRMKVFQDHAQVVEEKAPHVGMSIRASGVAESGSRKDGLPILKELTAAESVDVVTRAGAGGMILTESALPNKETNEMTLEETKRVVESAFAPFRARVLRADAAEETRRVLEGMSLHAETKERIIERVTESIPTTAEGDLDTAKLRENIIAVAKREGEYAARISGNGRVFGMGSSSVSESDPAKVAEARRAHDEEEKRLLESGVAIFSDLCGRKSAGERAALKGVA